MLIDQSVLLTELQALEAQRLQVQETLARIDGAVQLVRHLLQKAARPEPQQGPQTESNGEAILESVTAG